jgi:ribosomal protein L22
MADEEVKNPGGRPSIAEAEAHIEAALDLYLKGVVSATAIARELKISPQAGADLVKRIRNYFTTKDSQDDSFTAKRQLALTRAENLLAATWESYRFAFTGRERSMILKDVLATLEHISDLNGLTSKLSVEMTQKTISEQEQHEQMKKDLGLTDEDFNDAHFAETMKKVLNYNYGKSNGRFRITKLEAENVYESSFEPYYPPGSLPSESDASGKLLDDNGVPNIPAKLPVQITILNSVDNP